MGSSEKKDKPYEPWWLSEPLDPDRPMLEQWEEWMMIEPDEEEFQRQLKWMDENIYKKRDIRSLLEDTRDIISPPGEEDTIH